MFTISPSYLVANGFLPALHSIYPVKQKYISQAFDADKKNARRLAYLAADKEVKRQNP
jgi:hypothetical protein